MFHFRTYEKQTPPFNNCFYGFKRVSISYPRDELITTTRASFFSLLVCILYKLLKYPHFILTS